MSSVQMHRPTQSSTSCGCVVWKSSSARGSQSASYMSSEQIIRSQKTRTDPVGRKGSFRALGLFSCSALTWILWAVWLMRGSCEGLDVSFISWRQPGRRLKLVVEASAPASCTMRPQREQNCVSLAWLLPQGHLQSGARTRPQALQKTASGSAGRAWPQEQIVEVFSLSLVRCPMLREPWRLRAEGLRSPGSRCGTPSMMDLVLWRDPIRARRCEAVSGRSRVLWRGIFWTAAANSMAGGHS
mmetsp:Transcript_56243/g.159651  ORF Transcript_56243/g.159651 Transcript_56243/m.159651 type:complete len:242 (-) Transcript_56243:482-1207(-)